MSRAAVPRCRALGSAHVQGNLGPRRGGGGRRGRRRLRRCTSRGIAGPRALGGQPGPDRGRTERAGRRGDHAPDRRRGSLHVVSVGQGPVVVLAHGITANVDEWAPVASRLVAAGLRVVAYDERGHGQSRARLEGLHAGGARHRPARRARRLRAPRRGARRPLDGRHRHHVGAGPGAGRDQPVPRSRARRHGGPGPRRSLHAAAGPGRLERPAAPAHAERAARAAAGPLRLRPCAVAGHAGRHPPQLDGHADRHPGGVPAAPCRVSTCSTRWAG